MNKTEEQRPLSKPLNAYIDHTLLKPEATSAQIETLCAEAVKYGFYSVCVNSCYVELAAKLLAGNQVKIACVVGFPLGASASEIKAAETSWACSRGAAEVDMVLNVGALKEGRLDFVQEDIACVVKAASQHGSTVKVILETCLLSDEEIATACRLSEKAGAAFVKTSTGFSSGGATIHHVELMRQTVGDRMQVKASGGIRDYETAMAMICAGADRLGTSASVKIVEQAASTPIGQDGATLAGESFGGDQR